MKELTLEELKEIEFDILKYFDVFCKEHGIRYYLAFGTLLGAIRYSKFIPWDDDIDLLVPREDYERMIKLFRDSNRYKLFAFEKNSNFHYPFAKLCDMTTRKEQTVYKNRYVELGVEIDIFPLDSWDDDYDKAKLEVKRVKKYQNWLKFTKMDNALSSNPLKRFVWNRVFNFARMIGGAYFVKKMIKISNKPIQRGSRFVGAKVWPIYGDRGIIPVDAFEESIEIEFEGQNFPAPKGYDIYLTCLYGDYMPEPPKEKQKTHHAFKAYKVL